MKGTATIEDLRREVKVAKENEVKEEIVENYGEEDEQTNEQEEEEEAEDKNQSKHNEEDADEEENDSESKEEADNSDEKEDNLESDYNNQSDKDLDNYRLTPAVEVSKVKMVTIKTRGPANNPDPIKEVNSSGLGPSSASL